MVKFVASLKSTSPVKFVFPLTPCLGTLEAKFADGLSWLVVLTTEDPFTADLVLLTGSSVIICVPISFDTPRFYNWSVSGDRLVKFSFYRAGEIDLDGGCLIV